ncbi:MAG: DUF1049 domain-containing protein [Oligoflexia bacterium]|nr:DUF1049 domain-containing protein [Oligoflexia bacterium]
MIRPILVIVLSILGTIFIIQNSDHVPVQLFWGNPISVRLVFLLILFYIIGYSWATFNLLNKQRRLRRQIKHLKIQLAEATGKKINPRHKTASNSLASRIGRIKEQFERERGSESE